MNTGKTLFAQLMASCVWNGWRILAWLVRGGCPGAESSPPLV
jgi:hypothetical protein